MIEVLRHATFRRLFSAQVVALIGTGLATTALALLAYDLAGAEAGAVLGTALAIKMIVYVLLAPLSGAFVPPAKRKVVLISLDIVRACAALALPFVNQVWQIYLLIALLQSASACFTPLFQSLIPQVLPEERDYTKALSLSRLAYDLESLLSPALAAMLLTVISFHGLFFGTVCGFVLSAAFVFSAVFPHSTSQPQPEPPLLKATRGMRIYLNTPRLQGLLALNLCAAAGGAMVFVNTVVIVRQALGGGDQEVAWALAAFGGGSMIVALLLPSLLDRVTDRTAMLWFGTASVLVLGVATLIWVAFPQWHGWGLLLPAWVLLGMAYAGLVTPGGRLLRRSAHEADLPAVFAAQFSLSHVCWLLAYPLAGWLGAQLSLGAAFVALSFLALAGRFLGGRRWPVNDPTVLAHAHEELSADHPHFKDHPAQDGRHAHLFVVDELHRQWPR